MSARSDDLRSGDRFELLGLPIDAPRMLAEILRCGVELMLIACQRGAAQLRSHTPPGVDVTMAVEAHHRGGLDGVGEVSEVSGSLSELVRPGGCVHLLAVGASEPRAERVRGP